MTYENPGFFVATTKMSTRQARGICLGTYHDEICSPVPGEELNNCSEGMLSRTGRQTGRCNVSHAEADLERGVHRCEVEGWCPGEPEDDEGSPLENVGNFTVFMRMNVKFPGMRDALGRTLAWDNANGTEPTMARGSASLTLA